MVTISRILYMEYNQAKLIGVREFMHQIHVAHGKACEEC